MTKTCATCSHWTLPSDPLSDACLTCQVDPSDGSNGTNYLEGDSAKALERTRYFELQTLRSLQREIHANAVLHGWWEDRDVAKPDTIASCLCLVHSEVSEALEEVRKGPEFLESYEGENGKPEGCITEMADAVIRLFDLAEGLGLDLGAAIMRKHAYNKTRPFRHGGKVL